MKRINFLKKSSSLIAGLLVPVFSMASTSVYVVQPGDTLSGVLHRMSEKPVYGKNGSLLEVLRLNPKKFHDLGNSIYPGEKISLPESFQTRMVKIDENAVRCEPVASEPERRLASESVVETKNDEISSVFSLGIGTDYFRIDSIDASSGSKSAILSNLSPSLLFGWKLNWSAETAFLVQAGFERYSLQPPKTITFDHLTGMRSAFSIGVQQKLSDRFEAAIGFTLQDRLFFHASGLTELTIDQVMIASPTLTARYSVMSKPGGQVGFMGSAGLLLPTSNSFYDVKSGTHADLGVFFHRQAVGSNHGFEFNLNYTIDSQDTTLLNGTEKKFLLKLIYSLED